MFTPKIKLDLKAISITILITVICSRLLARDLSSIPDTLLLWSECLKIDIFNVFHVIKTSLSFPGGWILTVLLFKNKKKHFKRNINEQHLKKTKKSQC